MNRLPISLLAFVLFSGCDSSDPLTIAPSARVVWVANGGNFSDQNGSLSRIEPGSQVSENGPVTDGFIQAVEPVGEELLVLVNTFSGGRIDIVSEDGRTVRASIRDIDAPRAAEVVGELAYVTTFGFDGSGQVLTVSLATGTLVGEPLGTGLYPEGIVSAGGRLLIANAGFIGTGTTLTAIKLSDGSSSEVNLGCDGPRDVVALASGDVAVTCLGKTVYNDDFSAILEQTNGQVVFLDGQSLTMQDRVLFDSQLGSTGGGQAAAASTEELLVLEGATATIRRISLNSRLQIDAWTLSQTELYVGVSGIASVGSDWYVGRLARSAGGAFPDYTAAGQVVILSTSGDETGAHAVGPAPTHIAVRID